MTLQEAVSLSSTGYIHPVDGCPTCKVHPSDATDGDWEPWTEQHECNLRFVQEQYDSMLAQFFCDSCGGSPMVALPSVV